MPEGDSVFRLAARLRAALDDGVLASADLRVPRHATADLAGRRVLAHDTVGKHLLQRFEGGLTLHTHLRLDGSWTVTREGRAVPRRVQPDVRVRLTTTAGTTAWGIALPVVELVETRDEGAVVGFLGPDPLRADWDEAEAVRRVAADPARPVLEAIRDQRNLAGLGNLWVNEVCFLRGVHPDRPVREVALEPLVRLAARMLRHSATHPDAYQVTTGSKRRGESHWVVGRAGRPCLRCGTTVVGRGEHPGRTYWCPHCQPSP
ncbi:DNA-formamidopyrimidine glycosylase family protein [Amnibacterium setariae]|uniref:DNA-(apurinic or apyrimidinic site) lyase n=1 Tax=Amnibacterium setariae TaxID=2306585 RepID=A0A3A1TV80_9MICO|nr:DNA-formamidopyrimidine glycosylase family protein [Amnibacterium setariae]RIX27699.1 Fpg/Nei family DNA glycosylase [Amnibacterium setariae]